MKYGNKFGVNYSFRFAFTREILFQNFWIRRCEMLHFTSGHFAHQKTVKGLGTMITGRQNGGFPWWKWRHNESICIKTKQVNNNSYLQDIQGDMIVSYGGKNYYVLGIRAQPKFVEMCRPCLSVNQVIALLAHRSFILPVGRYVN